MDEGLSVDEGKHHVAKHVERLSSRSLLDVLIQAGLIAVLAVFCYGVFHPFRDLMLWSMILAVTLYPLHTRLRHKLGSDGRAATLIVLIGHRHDAGAGLFPGHVAGGLGGACGQPDQE